MDETPCPSPQCVLLQIDRWVRKHMQISTSIVLLGICSSWDIVKESRNDDAAAVMATLSTLRKRLFFLVFVESVVAHHLALSLSINMTGDSHGFPCCSDFHQPNLLTFSSNKIPPTPSNLFLRGFDFWLCFFFGSVPFRRSHLI